MGRRFGRAHLHAALSLLVGGGLALPLGPARADEVIMDPELMGDAPGSSEGGGGDEVIADPELAGSESNDDTGGGGEEIIFDDAASSIDYNDYDPMANTGIAKLDLATQAGFDINQESNLEDFYEVYLRLSGEVDFRISRHLRLGLGTRINFFYAAPHQADSTLGTTLGLQQFGERALDEDRYALDIIPSSAYVDTTLMPGLHLRIGVQPVSLGRMDFYAPTDILAVFDLRPQPAGPGGSAKLSQPAVRLDWDLSRWATLQMVYVPWFMPHVTLPNRDQYVAQGISGRGAVLLPSVLGNEYAPSWQVRNSNNQLRFLGPEPDFSHPQAQARLTLRGSAFEIAASGGTALEKLPSVYLSPVLDYYLRKPPELVENGVLNEETLFRLGTEWVPSLAEARDIRVMDVAFHRYFQVGLDGSFDIAPISIGFEVSYSPRRYWLYAARKDGQGLPRPNVTRDLGVGLIGEDGQPLDGKALVDDKTIRAGVPVIEAALHVEWIRGESLALMGEAFLMNALELPYDLSRDWAGFIPDTGAFVGGMVAGTYSIKNGRVNTGLAVIAAVGPTLIVAPQIEVQLTDGFYANVGAMIIEGPDPGINIAQGVAATKLNIGGLLSGNDQILVGLRWSL